MMETVPPSTELEELLAAPPTKRTRKPLWLRMIGLLAPSIIPILYSPLHGVLSGKLMLVTVKQRRSETVYTFPVRYLEIDALVIALAPNAPSRSWWKNFIEPSYASITIRGRRTAACGFAPRSDTPEFAKAAEQYLRQSRIVRWFFGVKLKKDRPLTPEQAEALGQNTRVVIFDRSRLGSIPEANAVQNRPALADAIAAQPDVSAPLAGDDSAELRLADLIGPVLAELEREERPAALALAERVAAERYRMWAKEISDPTARTALADCAMREDDIAARVEAAVPGALAIQQSIARAHPDVAAQYLDMFTDMTLEEQFAFQASIQRAAADTWRFLTDSAPAHVRGILLECSYLEEKSAAVLDTLIEATHQTQEAP